MICISLQKKTAEEILSIMDDPFVEMAEIRADLCALSPQELADVIESEEKPILVSYHCGGKEDWPKAESYLVAAIEAGVRFVDLDHAAPVNVSKYIQSLCRENACTLVRSYHDYDRTPDTKFLKQTLLRAFRYGADIAKLACKAKSPEDVERMMGIYDSLLEDNRSISAEQLLLISMGELGKEARKTALQKGAPFMFANYDEPSAEGQIQYEEMHEWLYGDWRGVHKADFHAPCSKSFAQRAIIAAALAEGESRLSGFGACEDSLSAIEVARKLGAKVSRRADKLRIQGIGPVSERSLSVDKLNVGESGLLTRLCIPLMAALNSQDTLIEGRGTLLGRPLNKANDIMAAFGILLQNQSEHKDRQIYVPLSVKGKFFPGTAEISGSAGSQLISGLLMSLPLCSSNSTLFVSEPKSIPYMFITQDVLKRFGVKISCELEGDSKMLEKQDWSYCNGIYFKIKGGQQFKASDIALEGDWSAAAAFLCYGALFGEAEVSGLNTNSIQADITILDILSDAGACVSYDEEVVSVKRAPLQAFSYDLNNAPDLIPLASLLAAFCPGESIIYGVQRLKNKESDRAQAILQTLTQMGVETRILADEIRIKGMGLSQRFASGNLLKGGKYSSFHDHRMVMLLSIAQMVADSPIEIDDKDCVSKSFPNFFEELSL
ncbi:MAG: 3-phosphoshikimate 1-carboxyvinyltransferase [Candidatus Cryptobacteroides sp.]